MLEHEQEKAAAGYILVQTVLDHLARLVEVLRLPIQQSATFAFNNLEYLKEHPEHWQDLLTALLNIISICGGSEDIVSTFLILLDKSPESEQAKILAEYWASIISNKDDPVYSMAVALDTNGKKLAKNPQRLVMSFALAHRVQYVPYHRWHLEKLPPCLNQSSDVLAEALDAIDALETSFDNYRSWALEELSSLLQRSSLDLLVEAIIVALKTDDTEYRLNALRKLAFNFIEHTAPLEEVLKAARNIILIKHANSRSRILWRLASLFPLEEYFQLLLESLQSALKIENHNNRSRALWRLLPHFSGKHLTVTAKSLEEKNITSEETTNIDTIILNKSFSAAYLIEDPDDRARALARLAPYFSSQKRIELLKLTLVAIRNIKDERKLANTLRVLKPQFASTPDLLAEVLTITQAIQNPWYRSAALELFAPYFLEYQDKVANVSVWAQITLGAIFNDVRKHLALPMEIDKLWITLTNRTFRDAAVTELSERGKAKSLTLTSPAAFAIDWFLNQEQIDISCQLLSIVHKPEPETLPVVNNWLKNQNANVKSHVALLLAENNILTEQTIPHLVALLNGSDDRLRHRAALSLYNSNFEFPRLRTSVVGRGTIEIIAHLEQQNIYRYPYTSQPLKWMWENLIHDDPVAINQWIELLVTGTKDASTARNILFKIKYLKDDSWHSFLNALSKGTPALQKILLNSTIHILHGGSKWLPEKQIDQLRSTLYFLTQNPTEDVCYYALEAIGYLSEPSAEDIAVLKKALDQPEEIASIALVALGRLAGSLELDTIRRYLSSKHPRLISAADEAIARHLLATASSSAKESELNLLLDRLVEEVGEEPDRLLTALMAGGKTRRYSDYYKIFIKVMGLFLERYPKQLEKIVALLPEVLSRDELKDNFMNFQEKDLWMDRMVILDILGIGSKRLPSTFANAASKIPQIEKLLIKAVQEERTFMGRISAMTALSFLRRVSSNTIVALQSALRDSVYAQESALIAVSRFRTIENQKSFLRSIREGLYDESAAAAYATAQMLTAIGRANSTSSEVRQYILNTLAEAVQDPRSNWDVFTLELEKGSSHEEYTVIKHQGRLDQLFYQSLMQVIGISGVNQNVN